MRLPVSLQEVEVSFPLGATVGSFKTRLPVLDSSGNVDVPKAGDDTTVLRPLGKAPAPKAEVREKPHGPEGGSGETPTR